MCFSWFQLSRVWLCWFLKLVQQSIPCIPSAWKQKFGVFTIWACYRLGGWFWVSFCPRLAHHSWISLYKRKILIIFVPYLTRAFGDIDLKPLRGGRAGSNLGCEGCGTSRNWSGPSRWTTCASSRPRGGHRVVKFCRITASYSTCTGRSWNGR